MLGCVGWVGIPDSPLPLLVTHSARPRAVLRAERVVLEVLMEPWAPGGVVPSRPLLQPWTRPPSPELQHGPWGSSGAEVCRPQMAGTERLFHLLTPSPQRG